MPRRATAGFTLVELLVVITIIGILVGLLMPAVMGAREQARKTQCANHQKELSQALMQYETSKHVYPGVAEMVAGRRVSWVIQLFPYMGRTDLWNLWRMPRQGSTEHVQPVTLAQLMCPSDPRDLSVASGDTAKGAQLAYVANCGMQDTTNASYSPDWAANGVFHNLAYDTSNRLISGTRIVKMASNDIRDGTQYTIAFSENLQGQRWMQWPPQQGNVQPNNNYAISEMTVGMVWWNTDPLEKANSTHGINQQKSYIGQPNILYARPSSNHSGGVNMSFCDGHQAFVKETIAYPIFVQLMTPNGKEMRMPGTTNPPVARATTANDKTWDWWRPLSDTDFQ